MLRSLSSGVAGMISHQTKMDVVGNNISNVSTYGYKSSRATFNDIYYQTNRTAMSATPSSGGTNPTQVGYGSKLGSIDVNHTQSVMSTTGYTLDVAISGEGYLQVMDADGNIFYTRAGMLDIDAEGNLVDINGYFVLGVSGNPSGVDPSSNRIKVELPYLQASTSSATDIIDNNTYTIESENQNENSNVNIQFVTSKNMPYGQKMSASITSASITITVNANEIFTDMADFNDEMNRAITAANGGIKHAAGDFIISIFGDKENYFDEAIAAGKAGLSGAEIVEPNFNVNLGIVDICNYTIANNVDIHHDIINTELNKYFSVNSVGTNFSLDTNGAATGTMAINLDNSNNLTITIGDGTNIYTETIPAADLSAPGNVTLQNPNDPLDSIDISYPTLETIKAKQLSGSLAALTAVPSINGNPGSVNIGHDVNELCNYFTVNSVGNNFSLNTNGAATGSMTAKLDSSNNLTITVGDGVNTYSYTIPAANLNVPGNVTLQNQADPSDSIVVSYPDLNTIVTKGLSCKSAALTIVPSNGGITGNIDIGHDINELRQHRIIAKQKSTHTMKSV